MRCLKDEKHTGKPLSPITFKERKMLRRMKENRLTGAFCIPVSSFYCFPDMRKPIKKAILGFLQMR